MTKEEITKKVNPNRAKKLKGILQEIVDTNKNGEVSVASAKLGLLFFTKKDRKKTNYYYSSEDYLYVNDENHKKFADYDIASLWSGAYYELLVFFFGAEMAPFVKETYMTMEHYMYQLGYYRRSFRRPNHIQSTEVRQINLIIGLVYHETAYYQFSTQECIKYQNHLSNHSSPVEKVWAKMIDADAHSVYEQIKEIILGDAEAGTVSRKILKALLYSSKIEAWQLVENLLLSAQRQEGLRQTILEALDETSIGAFGYLLNTIVKNDLMRFTSMVRAFDTWTGLGLEVGTKSLAKRHIKLALEYFNTPSLLEKTITSKDNVEVYMSLWAQGVHDIDVCYPYLKKLYKNGSIQKKMLVLNFVKEAGINDWSDEFARVALYEENPKLHLWATELIDVAQHQKEMQTFDRILEIYNSFKTDRVDFLNQIFSNLNFNYEKYEIGNTLIEITHLDDKEKMQRLLDMYSDMPVECREKIVAKILKPYVGYYGYSKEVQLKTPTSKQRDFAFRILKDRSEYIRGTAMRTLGASELDTADIQVFEGLLTRKSSEFRNFVLKMIQKRTTEEIFESADRLLNAKNVEQRLAGLDLLLGLQKTKEYRSKVLEFSEKYAERKRVGKREQVLLDVLLAKETVNYTAENGYGLYDVNNMIPLQPFQNENFISELKSGTGTHPYGLSKSISAIEKDLQDLVALIKANKDYEYEGCRYYGEKSKFLLANGFFPFEKFTEEEKKTPQEIFENYPLHELWDDWFKKSKLTPYDLYFVQLTESVREETKNNDYKGQFPLTDEKLKTVFPKIEVPKYRAGYTRMELAVINCLSNFHVYSEKQTFAMNLLEGLFALIAPEELNTTKKSTSRYWSREGTVFDAPVINTIRKQLHGDYSDDDFKRKWNLLQYIRRHTPAIAEYQNQPQLSDYCKAYDLQLCTKDEVFMRLMDKEEQEFRYLTVNLVNEKSWASKRASKILNTYPFLQELLDKAKERVLEIELKRGDRETSVSSFASNIKSVYGVDYLVKILSALGKDNISRGDSYYAGISKKEVMSNLLTASYPSTTDTQELFNERIKKGKFTDKRLIELSLFNQNWMPFIANYLGWKGLESGVWWLHAHTNEDSNAEKETQVARFSEIPIEHFKDGAVDYNWFIDTYKLLGKKHWQLLYESAKYISYGTGHVRAKLYADVILGNTKIREITKRIKEKRNKDYVRVYGLVPLSKKTPKKDLLNRYNYLQQFKKERKQFGAQRQESEALAVSIALENLARTAGYPDPIRLTWGMETEEAKIIMANAEVIQYDDYTIALYVDSLGKAHIESKRGDKILKSIPSKYRKEKNVVELTSFKKRLKDQYIRSRKSLEQAMVRGDVFQAQEIHTLSEHPVIAPMLSTLALISDGNIGFYKEGGLLDENGNSFALSDEIRIAHCTDFNTHKNWAALQRYCFDQKIVQPFKQIFRELYVPTADELQEVSVSRRYAGHQVQPKKTVALLKTKGWTVDYEEGLQRVFHREGIIAKMFAMADWFSPADTECPTLETVQFFNRKDYKPIAFKDIDPLLFSEVMRDLDLVVSVAHVGGVDPEASQSTVEMRASIIKETTRLFKLDNVEIKGHHAHIKGHFGEYSVHLGSAVTHLKPGKYISILPVHSQHRGRLFLPFVDEDPRSAELMSKILLLAKDKEMKDPTILSQIQG